MKRKQQSNETLSDPSQQRELKRLVVKPLVREIKRQRREFREFHKTLCTKLQDIGEVMDIIALGVAEGNHRK